MTPVPTAGVVSAEGILDPDSEDLGEAITDMEAMVTVLGLGETTWEEVLIGWAVAIMATEEALPEVMTGIGDISAAELDSQVMAMAVFCVAQDMAEDPAVQGWVDGTAGMTTEVAGTGTNDLISTKSNIMPFHPELT